MTTPLGEIVDSTEPVTVEPEKVEPEQVTDETVETKAEETTETIETVETKAEEETKAAPSADVLAEVEDLKKQLNAQITRSNDERAKRQAIEQKAEKADAYTEPDKAIEQAVNDAKQETWSAIRLMQENNARSLHDDYDEKFTLFEKMAVDNPTLIAQAQNEFDPAAFIYKTASNHAKLEELGDLDTFEERIRAEERAKVEAELNEKQKELTEKVINDAIPTTLSGATAAGGTGGATYSGPTPLSKIVG